MIKIKSRGNESIDQMLKRFKKLCEKEGLVKDIKRNSYYEKPSERLRRKLSQETLAGKAGLSISYISMLERGQRTPPLDTLESLAKALGVGPASLIS